MRCPIHGTQFRAYQSDKLAYKRAHNVGTSKQVVSSQLIKKSSVEKKKTNIFTL